MKETKKKNGEEPFHLINSSITYAYVRTIINEERIQYIAETTTKRRTKEEEEEGKKGSETLVHS